MSKVIGVAFLAVIAALGVGLMAGPADAVTLTWNTCNGGSNNICQSSTAPDLTPSPRTSTGSNGDKTYTFEAIGDATRLLTARAFKTENSKDPLGEIFRTSINIFEGGLGAGGESSPQHAVDNIGPDELIVYQFGQDDYIPLSFRIGYKSGDADIVTYIGGTLGGAADALDLFLPDNTFTWDSLGSGLTALGYTRQVFLDVPVGIDQIFATLPTAASGRYLIIGAKNETDGCATSQYPNKTCDGGEDTFKIQQVVGELPVNVPEPGTMLLLATGLVALAPLARRRSG